LIILYDYSQGVTLLCGYYIYRLCTAYVPLMYSSAWVLKCCGENVIPTIHSFSPYHPLFAYFRPFSTLLLCDTMITPNKLEKNSIIY